MYKYINQLDPQNEKIWGHLSKFGMDFDLSISKHGCGLCSLSMVIENLTGLDFTLDKVIELAQEWNYGGSGKTLCEMKVLGPVVAELFNLRFATTSIGEELLEWLQKGGMAIAHSNGDRENHVGIFTSGKHYVAVVGSKDRQVIVLDPSQTPDKFEKAGRKEYVTVNGHEIYVDYDVLAEDCEGKIPRFYLFANRNKV